MASKKPLRLTKQRQVIMDEMRKHRSHPTANEVYQLVRKRLPNISLGTVYRNLEILFESGMIQKLELAGTQKRFDGITDNHYHVRCQECGRVDDVPGEPILSIVESLGARTDYKILSHRIELVGLCPRCTRRKGERAGKLADKASRHAAGSGTRGDRFQG